MPHLDIAIAIIVLAPATKGMAEVLTHMSPAASRLLKKTAWTPCMSMDTAAAAVPMKPCQAEQAGLGIQQVGAPPICTAARTSVSGCTESQTQNHCCSRWQRQSC